MERPQLEHIIRAAAGITGAQAPALPRTPEGPARTMSFDLEKDARRYALTNKATSIALAEGMKAFDKVGQQIKHINVPETWTANLSSGGRGKQTLSPTASKGLYAVKRKGKGAARE